MSPFDPTDADLARIDRARAEDWLRAHGWEACPWMLPPDAGCWWRLVEGDGLDAVHHAAVVPADGVGDAARRWRDALRAVSEAHDLRWLALAAVVVAWMAPKTGSVHADCDGLRWTRIEPDGPDGNGVWRHWTRSAGWYINDAEGRERGLP